MKLRATGDFEWFLMLGSNRIGDDDSTCNLKYIAVISQPLFSQAVPRALLHAQVFMK